MLFEGGIMRVQQNHQNHQNHQNQTNFGMAVKIKKSVIKHLIKTHQVDNFARIMPDIKMNGENVNITIRRNRIYKTYDYIITPINRFKINNAITRFFTSNSVFGGVTHTPSGISDLPGHIAGSKDEFIAGFTPFARKRFEYLTAKIQIENFTNNAV